MIRFDGGRGRTCLVTGATGFVGNNVVRLLADEGFGVRVLERPAGRADDRPLARLAVERIRVAPDDDAGIAGALDGVAAVVHAGVPRAAGRRHLAVRRDANVVGTRRLARVARLAGARFVLVSDAAASAADGRAWSPRGPAMREAEAAVLQEVDHGLDAVIVSPVRMLGPWDWKPSGNRPLLRVAAGRGFLAPAGGDEFVDVRDVAAGIRAAIDLGRAGCRYVLGGHPRSHLEAWTLYAGITGRRPPLGAAPAALGRAAAWCRGLAEPCDRRDATSTGTRMVAAGSATDDLGYAFRPLEDTARDAWRWFVTRGLAAPVRRAGAGRRSLRALVDAARARMVATTRWSAVSASR